MAKLSKFACMFLSKDLALFVADFHLEETYTPKPKNRERSVGPLEMSLFMRGGGSKASIEELRLGKYDLICNERIYMARRAAMEISQTDCYNSD